MPLHTANERYADALLRALILELRSVNAQYIATADICIAVELSV